MRTSSKGKAKKADSVDPAADAMSSSPITPLIFISHDTRDAELAEAFSRLLSSVSAGVLKSFRTSDRKGSQGIEYGVEWYPELMAKLNSASDVVCLLTQRSLDRPWILYEAGVAKGRLETPVYGIAIGIPLSRANTGPFAQFQNSDDSEDSLTKVVIQLVKRIPNAEPDRDAVGMQVRSFKERVTEILGRLGEAQSEDVPTVDETSVAKLFEEVKVMFQDLPSRIDRRLDPEKRRFRRAHPGMIEEVVNFSSSVGDPIGLLMILSHFRDDLPWLYELGLELYRAVRRRSSPAIDDAMKRFQMAIEFSMQTPFISPLRHKEMYFLYRELPYLMERFAPRQVSLLEAVPVKATRKKEKSKEE